MRGEKQIQSLAQAAIAQANLPKNVEKGDWRKETELALSNKLDEEVTELFNAIYDYRVCPTEVNRQKIREEAGDVVWTTAMLADKCGALEGEQKTCPSCGRPIEGEIYPGNVCFSCFRRWDP